MASRPLREQQNQRNDDNCEDTSGNRSAEIKPALAQRLVEEVAHCRAERPRENEGRPEEENAAHPRAGEVKDGKDRQSSTKHQGGARVTETPSAIANTVRGPVSKGRTQGLRERDGGPVEGFLSP